MSIIENIKRELSLKRKILSQAAKCQHGLILMNCERCKQAAIEREVEIANQKIILDQAKEKEQELQEIEKRKSWIEKYKNEHIKILPARYKNCTFGNFKDSGNITTDIIDEIKKDDWNLLFSGNAGCGKTHLAAATLKEILIHSPVELFPICHFKYEFEFTIDTEKLDFNFITMQELLLEIRDAFKGQSSEKDAIDKYTKYSVLIIDDLGAEKESEWTIQTFYYILNKRLNDLRPTIITTNLTINEIELKMNPRIASRLAMFKYFLIKKPDYRKKR